MKRRSLIALCGALFACTALPLAAQPYPDRPIRLLQGFAAGGNADAIARIVGAEMSKTLGQNIVVDALSGAGGTIAASAVARAKADGYTLLLGTGGHAVAGALYQSLPYKTVDDFEMVSTVTYFPFLVVVKADSKYQSLEQILADARKKPESVSYGTAGVGSTHHLAGELLAKMAGVSLMHVPYRGDSASLTALLAGDIPFIIAPPTAVMGTIQAGTLRAVATTGGTRWPGLPQTPTAQEQGVAGYDVRSWAGVLAPAGTPADVVASLNAAVRAAVAQPAIAQRLQDMGGEARASSPEEMRAMVASELARWTQVVADAGIPKQ